MNFKIKEVKSFLAQTIASWMISLLIFAPIASVLFSPNYALAADQPSRPAAYGTAIVVCAAAKAFGFSSALGASLATVPTTDKSAWGQLYTTLDTCATQLGNDKYIAWVADALEAVASAALHQLLATITNQIISYINSDDFGKKGVVLDFNTMLQNAANVAGAKFLNSLAGVNLCSITPRAKLQLSLLPTAEFKTQAECSLDKIVGNIDDFYNDFTKGGWIAWRESLKPNNTAFGTWLMAQNEKMAKEFQAMQRADKETAGGFTAKRKCLSPYKDDNNDGKNDVDPDSADCAASIVTTPSGTVETSVNFAALSPIRSLENNLAAIYAKMGPYGPYITAISNALLNRLTKDGINGLISAVFTQNDLTQPNPYQNIIDQTANNSDAFTKAQGNQAQANLILNTLKNFDQYVTNTTGPLYFDIVAKLTSIKTEQDKIINDFWAQGIIETGDPATDQTVKATVATTSSSTSTDANGNQVVTSILNVSHSQVGRATIQKQEVTYASGNKSVAYSLINKKNQIEDIDGIFTKYNTKYNALIYSQTQAKSAITPTQTAYDKITTYVNTWDGTQGNAQAKSEMDAAISNAIPFIQKIPPSTSTTLENLASEIVNLYNTTISDTTTETVNQTATTYANYFSAIQNIINSLTGKMPTL